jgi:hypothetical protein
LTRASYELTQKGKALLVVVTAIRQWGERFYFMANEKRVRLVVRRTSRPVALLRLADERGRPLDLDDVAVVSADGLPLSYATSPEAAIARTGKASGKLSPGR